MNVIRDKLVKTHAQQTHAEMEEKYIFPAAEMTNILFEN